MHGTGIYAENDEVILTSNVRLTANWKPIELEVTKEVTGLAGTAYENYTRTYSFILQRKDENGNWSDFGSEFSIDIKGDGTNSKLFLGFRLEHIELLKQKETNHYKQELILQ